MWQRGLNWAAIILVGVFGLMWLGVVIYADEASPLWMRIAEAVFGVLLACWAIRKAILMIIKES
ncbi:hypothetical protein GCM10012289_72150 [Nonomuraea cavernae]|uniref:Uncharacterized protein n=1 Tax=Nonomuraea cavernae TaxID=2045107 RepID=A0A917ZHL5_9ACTN|nr:hypothetical protein GCM10012289_72150 [Nonomuraea cavernae]